jgi:formylglycine-generating enzyme required for sulfatase activity
MPLVTPTPIYLAPTIADKTPYTAWKSHLGPAADALVTARVTIRDGKTGETTVRTGAGVIVRCDGLVLLPSSLLRTPDNMDGRKPERVTEIALRSVSTEGTPAADSFTASPPRFTSRKAPYVLVKVRDRHFRAAALLHPRNLSPTRAVEVVFPRPAATQAGREGLEAARVTAKVVPRGERDFGVALQSAPGDPPPFGAIVVDKASKMAVGILAPSPGEAENDPAAAFRTFSRLHDVTNAVALVPQSDDRLESAPATRKPGMQQGGMVWVPGGPLAVARTTDYPEIQGALVACSPGFWIDRVEVTVRDYRAFLSATGYRPLPQGWTSADVTGNGPAPRDPDLPIRGVTPADAAAYAEWTGKRLATPLEWEWASRGKGLAPPLPANLPHAYALSQEGADPKAPPRLSYERPSSRIWMGRGNRVGLLKLQTSLARSGTGWLPAYEKALAQVESDLRVLVAVNGYIEAKYWAFWQDPRNPQSLPGKRPRYADTPEFRTVVESITPSRAVADRGYAAAVEADDRPDEWHMSFGAVHARLTATEDSIRLLNEMFDPLPLRGAGARPYDYSVFGVYDVATNVPEWLQANQALRSEERAEKPLRPLFDPDEQPDWKRQFDNEAFRRLTLFNVALNGGDRFDFPAVQSKLAWIGGVDRMGKYANSPNGIGFLPNNQEVFYPGYRIDPDATLRILSGFPMPLLPFVSLAHPEDAPDFGAGFRCAR